jgi:hypothetical protein
MKAAGGDAKLGKMGADRIDHCGLLTEEQMARVVEHQAALLLELQLAWRDVSPTGFRHTGSNA